MAGSIKRRTGGGKSEYHPLDETRRLYATAGEPDEFANELCNGCIINNSAISQANEALDPLAPKSRRKWYPIMGFIHYGQRSANGQGSCEYIFTKGQARRRVIAFLQCCKQSSDLDMTKVNIFVNHIWNGRNIRSPGNLYVPAPDLKIHKDKKPKKPEQREEDKKTANKKQREKMMKDLENLRKQIEWDEDEILLDDIAALEKALGIETKPKVTNDIGTWDEFLEQWDDEEEENDAEPEKESVIDTSTSDIAEPEKALVTKDNEKVDAPFVVLEPCKEVQNIDISFQDALPLLRDLLQLPQDKDNPDYIKYMACLGRFVEPKQKL